MANENVVSIANERMAKMNTSLLESEPPWKVVQAMSVAYLDEIRRGGNLRHVRELLLSRKDKALYVAGSAIDLMDIDSYGRLVSDFGNLLFGETASTIDWGLTAIDDANFAHTEETLKRLGELSLEPYVDSVRSKAAKILKDLGHK